jgi:hypothetical protein
MSPEDKLTIRLFVMVAILSVFLLWQLAVNHQLTDTNDALRTTLRIVASQAHF